MRCAAVAAVLFACGAAHTKDGSAVGATVVDWKAQASSSDPRAADFTAAWKHPKGLGVVELGVHVDFGDIEISGVKRAAPVAVQMKVGKNDPGSKIALFKCYGPEEDAVAPAPLMVRCTVSVNTSLKDVEMVAILIHGDGQIDRDHATTAGELFFRK